MAYTLYLMPVNGATPAAIGTITAATSAHIGAASASSGSTVFGGDHLSTEKFGSLQVRAGAARFMLSSASSAAVDASSPIPSARLLSGTVVFSTANARAFLLHAATADIRPQTDQPTVAQVTYINDKELQVRSTRGSLTITVDGETQIVPEAMAYRVILDPDSYYAAESAQGPRGVGTRQGGPPLKAGRSHFLLIAIILTGIATGVALYEALQSPDAPH
jgi:ferric-dicitrate binding protein FerR (iron transport regulator)